MRKVVINRRHGGFGLSKTACQRYWEIKGQQVWIEDDTKFKSLGIFTIWLVPPAERIELKEGNDFYDMPLEARRAFNEEYSLQTWHYGDIDRDDTTLVQVVEEMGELANGQHADLVVVEIPEDVEWQIEEYDGMEWIAEKHRTWC